MDAAVVRVFSALDRQRTTDAVVPTRATTNPPLIFSPAAMPLRPHSTSEVAYDRKPTQRAALHVFRALLVPLPVCSGKRWGRIER